MDIQNLHAFAAVADAGSFSTAAEKLHLTQPAVSKRIALLEQELGAALFDRFGRRVSLTEAGRALLPHCQQIDRALFQAQQAVRDLSGEVSGRLRMATSHHIGLHRLPPVLRALAEKFPGVQPDIAFVDSEHARELVRQGDVELAVATLPTTGDEPGPTLALPVWDDPLCFIAADRHPLAREKRSSLPALAQHPAIMPEANQHTAGIVAALFQAQGLRLRISMATNYLETIRMLVSTGLGWTVLPRTLLEEGLRDITPADISLGRTLGVITHRERSLSRAAVAFRDLLLAERENRP